MQSSYLNQFRLQLLIVPQYAVSADCPFIIIWPTWIVSLCLLLAMHCYISNCVLIPLEFFA